MRETRPGLARAEAVVEAAVEAAVEAGAEAGAEAGQDSAGVPWIINSQGSGRGRLIHRSFFVPGRDPCY